MTSGGGGGLINFYSPPTFSYSNRMKDPLALMNVNICKKKG